MSLRARLSTVATLLDQGAADSAVRMLRNSWEPELPARDLVPLYCMWLRGLCETGDLRHALVLGQRAADEFPEEPDILTALGNVHDLRGDLQAAQTVFKAALERDPQSSLAHYNYGAVVERLGDEEGALVHYEQAVELDADPPGMFEATAALGALLRRQGRIEEAAAAYEAFLEVDPIHPEIVVEYGICLSDLERFDAAIEQFRLALSMGEDAAALYNLAVTLYRVGEAPEAIDVMERANRAEPEIPLTLAVLGSWYLASDAHDLDDALTLLYRALDLLSHPDFSDKLNAGYASMVTEEIFGALWSGERGAEAREVARMAAQRDWITPHMLETLNAADYGSTNTAQDITTFTILARAEAGERPEHWPEDANGYTTGLTVAAQDEEEARAVTLEYLERVENHPGVRFQLELVAPAPGDSGPDTPRVSLELPRARGVFCVHSLRAYFRR